MGTAGGFELLTLGARITSPPDVIDSSTFGSWRMFNVDSANVSFSSTITDNASEGDQAIRIDVTNTGGSQSYALDRWDPFMQTPVEQGTSYLVSFDAAWNSGIATDNLRFQVQEFDSDAGFLTNGVSELVSVSTGTYKKYTFLYRPSDPATARVGFYFSALLGRTGSTSINIDNARLEVAAPSAYTGFELSELGTTGGGRTGPFADTDTFLGWRLFSVGSPPITRFAGTIIDAGSIAGGQPGSHAMRLEIDNTAAATSADYGLDSDNLRLPVVPGSKYKLSSDLALESATGGPLSFQVTVAEFNAAGDFTGTQESTNLTLPVDQTFHRYSFDYLVTNPETTQIAFAFRPITSGQSVVVLDNVDFVPFLVGLIAESSNLSALWLLDQDNDGIPFGAEFALGTDPFIADVEASDLLSFAPSSRSLAHRINRDATDYCSWILQSSTDLIHFTDLSIYDGRTDTLTLESGDVSTTFDSNLLETVDNSEQRTNGVFYRFAARLFEQ